MYFTRSQLVAVFVCFTALSKANPIDSINNPTNPFDAGATDECEQPQGNSYCNTDYQIPSSIARIQSILETEIRAKIMDLEENRYSSVCLEAVKEQLCMQHFPRCQPGQNGETRVIHGYSDMCSVRLRESCDDRSYRTLIDAPQNICGFPNLIPNTGLYVSPCRPLSHYNTPLRACDEVINGETLVTPWIFEFIKQEDALAQALFNSSFSSFTQCMRPWSMYVCNSWGKCNSEGNRIELINTQEQCEELLSCFTDAVADELSMLLPCQLWPNRPLPTEPISTSDASPIEVIKTIDITVPPREVWPTPKDISLAPASALSSHPSSILTLMLVSLILLCIR